VLERSHKLVLLGGLHRSGTTPLTRALATHPDVSGLSNTGVPEDEGQHLQNVYPAAKRWGGSGHFARDGRSHLLESSPLATASNAERILASWSPYWDLEKHCLLEKSPPNLVMGRFLQALFPDAYFIMVIRHPVTVALSTRKWTRLLSRNPRRFATLSMLVKHWMLAHQLFALDRPHLRRVHVVRYEELVSKPGETLAGVQQFLDLDQAIPEDLIHPTHSAHYQSQWDALQSSLRPGAWQRRKIITTYSEEIAAWGYATDDLSWYSQDLNLQTHQGHTQS
jgi:hypothetical protein